MIILASGSPRRKELLEQVGIEFEVRVQNFDEISTAKDPRDYVIDIAQQKAIHARTSTECDNTIIAADTVVCIGDTILGKPQNKADAARMLALLSGKIHFVYTGVCIIRGDSVKTWAAQTKVEFFDLSEREIAEYIATGEPLDKAGAYGIQGKGAYLVKRIDGDYYNVMGLPIAEVCRTLK